MRLNLPSILKTGGCDEWRLLHHSFSFLLSFRDGDSTMLWDFSIGRALGMVLRTLPFIAFRALIYFGITLAYIIGTGGGAAIGYGIGRMGDEGFHAWSTLIGTGTGFGAVSIWAYWLREWLLYSVKTAHIAVMVHLYDGKPVPGGQSQIGYGASVVKENFMSMNGLFLLDQLVKGVVGAITGMMNTIASWLPIPGINNLVRIISAMVKMATTFIDELILAYAIRNGEKNVWEAAHTATVLYAQNHKPIIKNAVWLVVLIYLAMLLVFVMVFGPIAAVFYFLPEGFGWSVQVGFFALLIAWSIKQAILEPFAMACLMQVYFKVIEGQTPDPDWDRRLSGVSSKFVDIKNKAVEYASSTFSRTPPLSQ
jgi:hypothetical protein